MATAPTHRNEFDVAIICALSLEYDAVCNIFDTFWDDEGDRYGRAVGDLNTYATGRIGKHNVVLALLSQMGKASAASAAANVRSSFGSLELALLVGICAGVPKRVSLSGGQGDEGEEVLLGDVVISKSVVQYDFGRQNETGFVRKDTVKDNLAKAGKNIRNLLEVLETERGMDQMATQTAKFLRQLQDKAQAKKRRRSAARPLYAYPGTRADRLYQADYIHKHRGPKHPCETCQCGEFDVCDTAGHSRCEEIGCESSGLVAADAREALKFKMQLEREKPTEAQEPAIHLGIVASGDAVMRSAKHRDRIAKDDSVIAFEMEGAGMWEEVPCIVVKGVCDYADSHKSKEWQPFAAATAAAAARSLLERYAKTDRAGGAGHGSGGSDGGDGGDGGDGDGKNGKHGDAPGGVHFYGTVNADKIYSGISNAGGTQTNNFN